MTSSCEYGNIPAECAELFRFEQDVWGSIPGRSKIFVLSSASKPALGPPSVKLTSHLYLVPKSRTVELYLHSPERLD
jgi:hypothetical protein